LPTISEFLNEEEQNKSSDHKTIENRGFKHSEIYSHSPIIEIKNLTTLFSLKTNFWGKSIKNYTALDKINLEIYKG